jgi:hypothetical protein
VNWTAWNVCQNGQQTSTAQCQRSDGTIVASSECDNRGMPTTRSQNCESTPPEGYGTCTGGTSIGGVQVDNTPASGTYYTKTGAYQYPPKPTYFSRDHMLQWCRTNGGNCVQTSSYVVAPGPEPWSPAWTRSTMDCRRGAMVYNTEQPFYDENTGETYYPSNYYYRVN